MSSNPSSSPVQKSRLGCLGWGVACLVALAIASAIEQAAAPEPRGSGPAVEEQPARETEALRQRNEEQRLQAVAEACPGKPITGPVPALMARDLCPFIDEAAATEDAFALILAVNRPLADAITLRSLDVEMALQGIMRTWRARTLTGRRVELYYGGVHLATVSQAGARQTPRVRWRR